MAGAAKQKDIKITLQGTDYSWNLIKQRTVHAPTIKIGTEFLKKATPFGNPVIDDAGLRICKINKVFHILSGYNKVASSINNNEESLTAVLMSPSYLAASAMPPRVLQGGELESFALALKSKFSSALSKVSTK